jgi:hypothetical protein
VLHFVVLGLSYVLLLFLLIRLCCGAHIDLSTLLQGSPNRSRTPLASQVHFMDRPLSTPTYTDHTPARNNYVRSSFPSRCYPNAFGTVPPACVRVNGETPPGPHAHGLSAPLVYVRSFPPRTAGAELEGRRIEAAPTDNDTDEPTAL